jgi:ferredoxin-nitrite reductase
MSLESNQNGASQNGAAPTENKVAGFDPKSRHAKLKLTDDGRLATLAELGDERATLTSNERLKLEKPGPAVWKDIVERYAAQGFDAIEEDDFERFKWIGFYRQRPKSDGYFMLRVKVPGGVVSNEQLRVFSAIVRDYARGVADITTRQTFQMHWLTIDQAPNIMERLGRVGLGVLAGLFGPCGDICRNIVGSPLAGFDPEEVLDVRDLVDEASRYFSNHPDYADMPRKYKIGIFGYRSAGQCEINCFSLYGVKRADGEVGYGATIGGGLSTEPHLAQDMNVFLAPEQAMEVLEAATKLYRDHGYRKSRKHARLKYLIADWGIEKTRQVMEEYLGYKLRDAEPQPAFRGYEDKLGIHPQKDGNFVIGVPVVAGRVTSDQLDAIADIARDCGTGEIRLTVMQSFYIPSVPQEKTEEAASRLAAIGLPLELSGITRGVVACTGIEFCNLAVTETKARAKNIVKLLDEGVKWNQSEFFRVNVNGCPNSCGQHWIADVGLQGCTKKIDGQLVEHFDIFLGGGLGTGATFNKRIKRLPAEEVTPAIQKLIEYYQANKQDGESFRDFCSRQPEDALETVF